MTQEEFEMVRAFILERVKLQDYNMKEVEWLRSFYPSPKDEQIKEHLVIKSWLGLNVEYLERYASVCYRYDLALEELFPKNMIPLSILRSSSDASHTSFLGALVRLVPHGFSVQMEWLS
ncbi:hypothetical protein AMTRI_Chr12g269450 [Amborella trichopoda]